MEINHLSELTNSTLRFLQDTAAGAADIGADTAIPSECPSLPVPE